jgi:hypothetical protein
MKCGNLENYMSKSKHFKYLSLGIFLYSANIDYLNFQTFFSYPSSTASNYNLLVLGSNVVEHS